jgi:hypothetical protein
MWPAGSHTVLSWPDVAGEWAVGRGAATQNQDMSRFIVMKRTRDLQGCFLGGKKASYTHAKFPCSWTFAPSVPARGILLRVPAAGCRWRPRRPHRDAVRPSRRLSARVADCRPAPERGGSGLETGLPSSHGAPPLARAQVKALAAAGLTARPTLVDRPGGEWRPAPGTLAVWSGSSRCPRRVPDARRVPIPRVRSGHAGDDEAAEDGARLWES